MQGREKENEREERGMNVNVMLSVPKELIHPFFFSGNEKLIVQEVQLIQLDLSLPFIYEAAYFSGKQSIKPWEIHEQSISVLLEEWQKIKEILEKLFANRDQNQVISPMKKGISLFLEFVFWANGHPAILSKGFEKDQFSIKPVNIIDRLEFIIQRPSLYHSFIQLAELMSEMNKHYKKHLALKKASKHK